MNSNEVEVSINKITEELTRMGFQVTTMQRCDGSVEMTDDVRRCVIEHSKFFNRDGGYNEYVTASPVYKYITISPVYRNNGTSENVSIRVSCGMCYGSCGMPIGNDRSVKFHASQKHETQMKKVRKVLEVYAAYDAESAFEKYIATEQAKSWCEGLWVMENATHDQVKERIIEIENERGVVNPYRR